MTPEELQAHDDEARRRIESDLDTSFLVEAAAGTGKTTMLVRRLVAVLEAGRGDVDGVVAVTFTKKAAGELKLRLRQALDERRTAIDDPAARDRLEEAIARLEEAHIGTIHAFCAELLRQRPVEAGVDPSFAEADEDQSRALFERAFRGWIEERLGDPPQGLRRALARLAGRRTVDRASPLDRLRDAAWRLVDWRDFPAPWGRRPFERAAAIDRLLVRVRQLAATFSAGRDPSDYLRRALEPAARLWSWALTSARAGDWALPECEGDASSPSARDDDALEARLVRLMIELRRTKGWKGRGRLFAPGLERAQVAADRDALLEALAAFAREADADLAALLATELGEVVLRYEALKRRSGRLDFLDLLLRTRDLVRDQPAVRRDLQARYSHLFVDEVQDTDPLQAEIILLLAADDPATSDWHAVRPRAGKLFLVGDPKQSIYRFRRADVLLYEAIKEELSRRGVDVLYLAKSFRSVPAIQAAVNAAFGSKMTGDRERGQAGYVPLLPGREPPVPVERPDLVVIPTPRPYGRYGVYAKEIESSLPEAVGGWIAWLIQESGWTVADPATGEQVPIRPRHIALLFRRFAASWGRDAAQPYVQALEDHGVPHLLVGDRSFHARAEVETLRAALTAIEWPDDELSVFATLRGALFAISDAALLRFRLEIGRLDPFARHVRELAIDDGSAELAPIVDALGLLARLNLGRNRIPIADTIGMLLSATRAHAALALRPAGNQVLSNVGRIVDLARAFEQRGGLSFRGFVERLADAAEAPGAAPTPPLVEEGADGVRLMTVHAAKGLEFPIVVLADLTTRLVRDEPDHYADPDRGLYAQRLLQMAPWELTDHAESELARDAAEGIRVAYVAATRARDLLVIPAVGDGPYKGGWLGALDAVVFPPEATCRQSEDAAGCPPFGDVSVLPGSRPQKFDGEAERSVRPGRHVIAENVEPVWWDPALLTAPAGRRRGLHHEALLADGPAAAASDHRHRTWQVAQDDARQRGAEPSLQVTTVGDAPEPEELFLVEVSVEKLPRRADRPRGKRFGSLVHAVFRDTALDASGDQIGDLARLHGRILQATPEEIEAATEAVVAALDHPTMQEASASADVRRETPFVIEQDGWLIEGTIDFAYRDGDQWIVIDFKTDADDESLEERYRKQLAWYLIAVERLTGLPARGVLLAV